jgi:hypothetical protein
MGQTVNLVSQFGAPTFTSLRVIENTTLGGNLVVSGSITAQSLIVNATSVYSGSTRFGTIISDTHQFTGSILNSGSITVIGQYNGSGAGLTGTAASLSIGGNAATITSQANSATITAASINTANQIVLRDGSGNFSAGTITATLSGNATNITAYTINQNVGTSNTPTFAGSTIGCGVATGRSAYGQGTMNIVLLSSTSDSTGVCGIDFRSGNNYPSDGAQIYFESNAGGTGEKAKLTIRVENDLEDFMELRAGNITLNANTVSGGGQNPSIIFQNGGSNIVTISSAGAIVANSNITAYSDARVKTNIKTIDNALLKVLALRGVTYNRTDLEDKSEQIGVIAQEIKEILPQVVQETDGRYSVAYGNIVGVLIEAIKEQQAQIEELKLRL